MTKYFLRYLWLMSFVSVLMGTSAFGGQYWKATSGGVNIQPNSNTSQYRIECPQSYGTSGSNSSDYPHAHFISSCGGAISCQQTGSCNTTNNLQYSQEKDYGYAAVCYNTGTNYFSPCAGAKDSYHFQCDFIRDSNNQVVSSNYRHARVANGVRFDCRYCEQDTTTGTISGTRYAVFNSTTENTSTFTNCNECPAQSSFADYHIASCGGDSLTCLPNFVKTRSESILDNGKMDGTTMYGTNRPGYTCVCPNTDDYYIGPTTDPYKGRCGLCAQSGESQAVPNLSLASCNHSSGPTCTARAYKALHKTNTTGPRYGTYHCVMCPGISNASSFGVTGSYAWHPGNEKYTWNTSTRCKATTASVTDSSTGCKYYYEIVPSSSCKTTATSEGRYLYSTDSTPDADTLQLEPLSTATCSYTGTKFYSYAPAGWGVKNGSCVKCDSDEYSAAGSITCLKLPIDAVKSADGGSFECGAGGYKYNSTCYGCPIGNEGFNGQNTVFGTSVQGSTDVFQCFIPGSGGATVTDSNGNKYVDSSNCYFQDGTAPRYTPTYSGSTSNCQDYWAQSTYCAGLTGQAQGYCAQAALYGNIGPNGTRTFDSYWVRQLMVGMWSAGACNLQSLTLGD